MAALDGGQLRAMREFIKTERNTKIHAPHIPFPMPEPKATNRSEKKKTSHRQNPMPTAKSGRIRGQTEADEDEVEEFMTVMLGQDGKSHDIDELRREIPEDLQGKVTEEELKQARKYFLQFDLDSSGTISGNEFATCLLQMDADGRSIDDLLAEADFMPKEIRWVEFLRFIIRINHGRTSHRYAPQLTRKNVGIDARLSDILDRYYAKYIALAQPLSPSLEYSMERFFKEILCLGDPYHLKVMFDKAKKQSEELPIDLVKDPTVAAHVWTTTKNRIEMSRESSAVTATTRRTKRDDEETSSEEDVDDNIEKEIRAVFKHYCCLVDYFNQTALGELEMKKLCCDCGLFSSRRSTLTPDSITEIFNIVTSLTSHAEFKQKIKETAAQIVGEKKKETGGGGSTTSSAAASPARNKMNYVRDIDTPDMSDTNSSLDRSGAGSTELINNIIDSINQTIESEKKKTVKTKTTCLTFFQWRYCALPLIALKVYPEKAKHPKSCVQSLIRRKIIISAEKPEVLDEENVLGQHLQSPQMVKLFRDWEWPLKKMFDHYRDQDDAAELAVVASKGLEEGAATNSISLVEFLRMCRNFSLNDRLDLYLRVRCFRKSCHSTQFKDVPHLAGLDFLEWIESLARMALLIYPVGGHLSSLQNQVTSMFTLDRKDEHAYNTWYGKKAPVLEEHIIPPTHFHSSFMATNAPQLYEVRDISIRGRSRMRSQPIHRRKKYTREQIDEATVELAEAAHAVNMRRTVALPGYCGGLLISKDGTYQVEGYGNYNSSRPTTAATDFNDAASTVSSTVFSNGHGTIRKMEGTTPKKNTRTDY